jgi:glycosyltransferase involved in cell wall biosynthesis
MTVALIIPALDEEESLPRVLGSVPADVVDDILVVDNGSADRTAAVAGSCGARVITEARKGYGAACWAGFNAADADVLVFMDGDGSFLPHEIPRLIEPIASGRADLVLGSRTLNAEDARAIPVHARLGNKLVASIIGFASAVRLTDLGPFRAVTRKTLESLGMQERAHGWPCEMILKASKLGYRVLEVPVSYHPRTGGKSKVSGTLMGSIKAAFAMCRVTARWALWSPQPKK